jgi:hypothetical protein
MLPQIILRKITWQDSTRSQAVHHPHHLRVTMLTVSVQVASREVVLVISMVDSTLTAGQPVRHHRIRKKATGGQHPFSHHTAVQMPQVRQRLLIHNLATAVVDHGHGLIAIRHLQAMVTPTARSTNHLLAVVVAVQDLALVLLHQ